MCVHLFVNFTVFATCMCGAVGAHDAAELKFAVVSVFSWHFNVCAKILKDSKTVLEMLQQLEKMRHSGQK